MWYIESTTDTKKRDEAQREQFRRWADEAREKQKAREAWEAGRCPHCGRNDPLPPWLY